MVSLEPVKNQRTPHRACKRAPLLSGAALQGVTPCHGKPQWIATPVRARCCAPQKSWRLRAGPGVPLSRGQLPCVASLNTPTPHGPRAPSALPLRHELRLGNAHHQARSSPLGPGTSAWGAPGRQGPRQEENQEPWLPNQPLSPSGDGQAGPSLQSPVPSSHPHSPQGFHARFQRCP